MTENEFGILWNHFQGRLNGTELGPTMNNSAEVNAELLANPGEASPPTALPRHGSADDGESSEIMEMDETSSKS